MEGISTFFLFILLVNFAASTIAVLSSLVTYFQFKYVGHAWMALSFIALFIQHIIRTSLSFVPEDEIKLAWFFINVFILLGIWGLLLSSLFSQFDRLPTRTNWFSLLLGLHLGLMADPDNVTLNYDGYGYNAKYHPILGITSLILTLVFLILIIRPLVIKLRKDRSNITQPYFIILILAYSCVIFWAVTVLFTNNALIRNLRPLVFSFGLLFWGISIYMNPISLSLSPTKVVSVIIASKTGIPLISYDFEKEAETDTTLITPLITAIKSSMETFIGNEGELKVINFQDSLLSFLQGEHVFVIFELKGNTISSNIELMSKVYLLNFEKKYGSLIKSTTYIDPNLFVDEIKTLSKLVSSISV